MKERGRRRPSYCRRKNKTHFFSLPRISLSRATSHSLFFLHSFTTKQQVCLLLIEVAKWFDE